MSLWDKFIPGIGRYLDLIKLQCFNDERKLYQCIMLIQEILKLIINQGWRLTPIPTVPNPKMATVEPFSTLAYFQEDPNPVHMNQKFSYKCKKHTNHTPIHLKALWSNCNTCFSYKFPSSNRFDSCILSKATKFLTSMHIKDFKSATTSRSSFKIVCFVGKMLFLFQKFYGMWNEKLKRITQISVILLIEH